MLGEDEDMEDIENRLYSEVFHSKAQEDEELLNNVTVSSNYDISNNIEYGIKTTPRYFEQGINKMSVRTTTCNCPPYIQNNITINQYAVPPSITKPVSNVSVDSQRYEDKKYEFDQREKIRVKRQLRNAKRRENKRLKMLRKIEELEQRKTKQTLNKSLASTEVICLSDSDDAPESILIKDENVLEKKILNQPKASDYVFSKSDDDDDVVIIESEPVPIIDLDSEVEPTKLLTREDFKGNSGNELPKTSPNKSNIYTPKDRKEMLSTPESTTSNDFLDNSNIDVCQSKFNFSLHGSDFTHGDGEFLKPANPTDLYETESSCSTTDFSKEFNNSLKCAVFNEIEFPREDIFSESNLESFGTYITPNRKRTLNKTNQEKDDLSQPNNPNRYSSNSSSEESDYEIPPNTTMHKNLKKPEKPLPNLSPMQFQENVIALSENKQKLKQKRNLEHSISKLCDNYVSKKKVKKTKAEAANENPNVECVMESLDSKLPSVEKDTEEKLAESSKLKKKKKRLSSCESFKNDTNEVSIEQENSKLNNKLDKTSNIDIILSSQESELANIVESTKNSSTEEAIHCSLVADNSTSVPNNEEKKSIEIINLEDDSDLEIVDSEQVIKLKDLIVVDELCSTDAENVSILQIEDSEEENENIFGFNHVGHDVSLANCTNSDSMEKTTSNAIKDYSQFDVEVLQSTMSDDPECWKILPVDRFIQSKQRGPRCTNCREIGHQTHRCLVTTTVSCTICGVTGHYETRCPNKICTQCGNFGDYSTTFCWKCIKYREMQCHSCKMHGHLSGYCPDLWRRYHMTTKEGPLVVPLSPVKLKPRDQLWCSGCAKQGHIEQECSYLNREYPPTDICIHSYEDIYAFEEEFIRQNILPQNNEPVQEIQHNFVPNNNIRTNPPPTKDLRKIKHFIKSKCLIEIQDFLNQEISKLNVMGRSPKFMKKKLFHFENILRRKTAITGRIQKEFAFWHRTLNMFVFGLHRLGDGKKHLDYLKNFLVASPRSKLSTAKRDSLFNSYKYIFGSVKHDNIDYHKFLQVILLKQARNPEQAL